MKSPENNEATSAQTASVLSGMDILNYILRIHVLFFSIIPSQIRFDIRVQAGASPADIITQIELRFRSISVIIQAFRQFADEIEMRKTFTPVTSNAFNTIIRTGKLPIDSASSVCIISNIYCKQTAIFKG